jgi:hypothetical protein
MTIYTRERLMRVMQRELLCSEHAATCWLDAKKKEQAARRKRAKQLRASGFIISTRAA